MQIGGPFYFTAVVFSAIRAARHEGQRHSVVISRGITWGSSAHQQPEGLQVNEAAHCGQILIVLDGWVFIG
jgi:hypothetical protein